MQTSLQLYFASQSHSSFSPFVKDEKASLLVLCTLMAVGNTDTGIDPGFVDIKSTAVGFDDFKRQ